MSKSPSVVYLDTHIVVWLASDMVNRITPLAQSLIQQADLLFSPMVLLELGYLYELKRVQIPARDIQLKIEHEVGAHLCELSFATIARAALDEKWSRDPFDRLIVANAKANGFAPLISADENIQRNYPRTVW